MSLRATRLGTELAFLNAILDTAGALVYVTDREGHFVRFNRECERLTGWNEAEMLGQPHWQVLLRPEEVEAVRAKMAELNAENSLNAHENHWLTREGGMRLIQWRNTAMLNARGEVEYIVATGLDVTEERAAQRQLEQAMAELHAAQVALETRNHELANLAIQLAGARDTALASTQAKSQFLANMSHEVRTPLNGVIGTTSLLLERPLDDEARAFAEIVRSSGQTLLRVIDDILDYSKIEAGRLDIEAVPTDLHSLVIDVVALYQGHAKARGIWLKAMSKNADLPLVLADPVRVKQVLSNLVSNAVKFTNSGGVYVSLEAASENGEVHALFIVKDTGLGIALNRQEDIWGSFTQADSSTHRRFGGTGLGLAITKRLVDLMGGEITLQSAPNRGSTFQVELAFRVAENLQPVVDSEVAPAIPNEFAGIRVLVAEDNEVNAIVAEAMLEQMGCTVQVVGDGLAAISAATMEPFDLILMDMHMPVCDGVEAARTIRQQECTHLPIIALTASAMAEDRAECLLAGMDEVLTKPFRIEDLRAAIRKWVKPA